MKKLKRFKDLSLHYIAVCDQLLLNKSIGSRLNSNYQDFIFRCGFMQRATESSTKKDIFPKEKKKTRQHNFISFNTKPLLVRIPAYVLCMLNYLCKHVFCVSDC